MTNKELKIAYLEYESMEELNSQDKSLAEAAVNATQTSYAPFST